MSIFPLTTPKLLLNESICKANIQRMVKRAEDNGVLLRPHFKTHQSAIVGEWFREQGIEKITASSVKMAQYFADNGWNDILVAFTVNTHDMDNINELASRITLGVIVDNRQTAQILVNELKYAINVWLDVDTGYGRTGIAWDDAETLVTVANTLAKSEHITITGLLSHAGHTYAESTVDAVQAIHDNNVRYFQSARNILEQAGYDNLRLSSGDTPSASIVRDWSGLDDMRPGNFVFYDVMQSQIGACSVDDIAVGLVCPVVSMQPAKNKVVVYGGAVHLSKDRVTIDGETIFGLVSTLNDDGTWTLIDGAKVISLSQEHGVIHMPDEALSNIQIGDALVILPIHSCLTANLCKSYVTWDGQVIEMMR